MTRSTLDQVPAAAIVGEFTNRDDLIEHLRQRAEALGLSNVTLDALGQFPEGYAGKILAPTRMKTLTVGSLLKLTSALGVKGVLVIDDKQVRRMKPRWESESKDGSKVHSRRSPSLGKATLRRVLPAAAAEMGRRGGLAWAARTTPEQRRDMGRRGAAVRWGTAHADHHRS
jgi:hypothetical protein